VKTKSCPNYIKESNQQKIGSKVQQVNKSKANEHKITKRHMLKDISHFKIEKQITRNKISNSQREQGSNNKPNSPHFL
jgi:hypothetical protein